MYRSADAALDLSGSTRVRPSLYDQWLGYLAEHACALRLDRKLPDRSGFEAHMRSRSANGFSMLRILSKSAPYLLVRDETQIAEDGQDRYGICLSVTGGMDISQFGRQRRIIPRAFTIFFGGEPGVLGDSVGGANDTIGLFLPRDFVERRVPDGRRLCAQHYGPDSNMLKLVFETMLTFERLAWNITDEEFQKAAKIVAELVLLATSGAADLLCGVTSVKRSNLLRIKRIVRKRISNSDLSPKDIAREAGVSLSYLHALFREDGCTVWEYVKQERLQKARDILGSNPHATITDVAMECGFSNMPYFSAVFKRSFGLTPKDTQLGNTVPRPTH